MILKAFEINKINLNKNSLFLLHGENEGYKNEILKEKFEKNYKNQIYKYNEKEILENKYNFFNSIFSKSFFEDKKLIIILRATDKIKDTIEEIIEKGIEDIQIIILSNILEKKSKLRNLFEKNKELVSIAFYPDTVQILNSLTINFLREKKISISQETVNLIVERSRGNRENLNNELQKIENFSKTKSKITNQDILKLTNLAENYDVSELTDNCLAKNIKKTSHILNENNFTSEDCILIIRTLLYKSKRILKIQEQIEKKNNIEKVISDFKPPIFWKDKDILRKQINKWSLKNIKYMILEINNTELTIKKNSSNSLNILSNFILTQASN
tara:strand:+ start:1539 stop:2525 length:987 start_codon:yes stop_codon:yes gene_type:complete